eukprot:TRINITY_DN8022_c0_g1_i5.p1 TRINITY_DN8022_c0_g1~~TRINITY_DN8022_c0_g1_i5.p1  ORF type:complete len:374 (-),score=46.98 TRINITY_DN8022_c0_g1_i5:146-1267(-)
MSDDNPAIVIDNGSWMCKAGFAGEDPPQTVFYSAVGRPKGEVAPGEKDSYVGDEAQLKRDVLDVTYPIQQGLIINWDEMEKLWQHTFDVELGVSPADRPVLLSEPPLNRKANREKTTQIMFEKFHTPATYLANQAVLALFATGRTTGLVLDAGHDICHAVTISDGFANFMATTCLHYGGHQISEYLQKILVERCASYSTSVLPDIFRDMKEKLCYVSWDYDDELRGVWSSPMAGDRSYELPDGQIVTLNQERFRCAEALFQPALMGNESHGIHQGVYDTIMKSGFDIRRDLFHNIVLAGGSTLFEGLADRLSKEVIGLAPNGFKIKVIAPPERKYGAFIGGAILASLTTFSPMWISRQDYDEFGPSIVQRKCT